MTAWAEMVALPVRARRLLLASALNNFGSGLVLPLLVAYVSRGLEIDVRWATTAVALTSLGAAVGGPLAGWAADAWGRLRTVSAALLMAMSGSVIYGLAQQPAHVLLAAVVLGLGVGGNSAWFTVLAESVDENQRSAVFGANLMIINAALGLGGLIGGLAVHSGDLMGFRALYLANALTFLLAAALLLGLRGQAGTPATASTESRPVAEMVGPGGYLAVLRTPGLWPVLLLALAAFLAGYSQLEVAVPGVMLEHGLGTGHVATAFAVNTVVVVVGQFILLPRLRRRRPLANVVGFALLWTLAWGALGAVTLSGGTVVPVLLGCLCLGVFALGECLYGVTLPTMINAVASDANRGRVNGLYSLATSAGFFLGPLASGQLLVAEGPRVLALVLAGSCAAVACGALLVAARSAKAPVLESADA